jgi:hypothetical protein
LGLSSLVGSLVGAWGACWGAVVRRQGGEGGQGGERRCMQHVGLVVVAGVGVLWLIGDWLVG